MVYFNIYNYKGMIDLNTPLYLEYTSPAPDYADFFRARIDDKPNSGWEKWSLPLGNSHFGASLFGRTETDRIQITENSLSNPLIRGNSWKQGMGGTRSFGDLIFEFGHKTPIKYRRSLSLDNAVSVVSYEYAGVKYEREYFLSYPDNVLAMRFTASKGGIYEDGEYICYEISPLIYSDLHSYTEAYAAGLGILLTEQDWQRIENIYNYYTDKETFAEQFYYRITD